MIKFARTCVLLKPKIPYSPFNHKIIARFNVIITLIVIFIVSKMSKINSKTTYTLSAVYDRLSFGEENMKSYYNCIIGCNPKDPQCRNMCAIRALNIEVQTTLPDASSKNN